MDISKFKGPMQGVFRSYSSLLVPIGIALIGVLLFVPTQLMSSKLQEQINAESISTGGQIGLLRRSVPSSEQCEEEERRLEKLKNDASEIELLAKRTTQRQLLSYEIFPEPKHDSVFIFRDFGHAFRRAVEKLAARVNAGRCPTEAEIDRIGKGWSKTELGGVDATIKDGLCRQKAESASVYASPSDLAVYTFWGKYKYAEADTRAEAIRDCWYSQLAYWIIEDLFDTIVACNSGSDSVFTSPLKRLLSVSFTTGAKQQSSRASGKNNVKTKGDKPMYVLSVDDALTRSCTKRVTKDDIDVVHFKVSVVVSADAVLSFMKELCSAKQHKFSGWDGKEPEQILKHNQITILEYTVASIDRADVTHGLYRYGEDAVVKLDLTCEYVFNKAWYEVLKSEAVKEDIKGSPQKGKGRKYQSPKGRPGATSPGSGSGSWDVEEITKRGG
jgi:hypothetical protein